MAAVADTTRAFVLDAHGGPEVLRLLERETPVPGAGEVLVSVEAAGVNFGDTMIRRGTYLRDQPLSFAPGAEVVGRVVAAGADVQESAIGARVAGWLEAGGGYADHVVVPAHRAYGVPEDLPAGAICTVFLQGTTAQYGVHRFGRMQAGEWVLVHAAAGGVGSLAVQLAKIGGGRVVATASTDAKRQMARAHGSEVVLDSSEPDTLARRIREATDGHGADVVLDGVGGPLFMPSMRSLAPFGRYVIAGSASQEPAMIDVRHLLPRTQTICGFILARITEVDPAEPSRALLHLCDLIRSGSLHANYETLALEEAVEVHRRMDERSIIGKVVLQP